MAQDLGALLTQAAQAQSQLRRETANVKRMLYEARKQQTMQMIERHLAYEAQKKAEKKAQKRRNIQMGALAAAAVGAGFLAPALAASGGLAAGAAGTGATAAAGATGMSVAELSAATGLTGLGATTAGIAATVPIFSPLATLSTLGLNVDDLLKYGQTGWGSR